MGRRDTQTGDQAWAFAPNCEGSRGPSCAERSRHTSCPSAPSPYSELANMCNCWLKTVLCNHRTDMFLRLAGDTLSCGALG
jgi:hypothetical protein